MTAKARADEYDAVIVDTAGRLQVGLGANEPSNLNPYKSYTLPQCSLRSLGL